MGYVAEAEMNFEKAVDVNGASYLGVMGMADCQKARHQYAQAIQLYSQSQDILSEVTNNKTASLHL